MFHRFNCGIKSLLPTDLANSNCLDQFYTIENVNFRFYKRFTTIQIMTILCVTDSHKKLSKGFPLKLLVREARPDKVECKTILQFAVAEIHLLLLRYKHYKEIVGLLCYFLQNSFIAFQLSSLAWPLEWTA
jgi:hypothetical protein